MIILFAAIIIAVIVAAIVTWRTLKSLDSTPSIQSASTPNEPEEQEEKKSKRPSLSLSTTTSDEDNTVQDFLPFERIEDSMIWLSQDRYRMLIEVNSINYLLRTDEEQNLIEEQFSRYITGWAFPWCFYVQTREIDNRSIVENLQNQVSESIVSFPKLAEYGREYVQYVRDLPKTMRNNLIKKKYIILFCDDANKMTELDHNERKEYAFEQLYSRASIVINNLNGIGLSAHICRTNDLAEVVYQSLNKKNGGTIDGILDGSFRADVVEGDDNKEFNMDEAAVLVNEFLNKLETNIINDRAMSDRKKVKALGLQKKARELLNYDIDFEEEDKNSSEFIAANTKGGTTGMYDDDEYFVL